MSEPKRGWFQRLSEGLSRSSRQMTEQVTGALTKRPLDQSQLDALEEMLIEADLGPAAAARITESFAEARFGRQVDETEVKEALGIPDEVSTYCLIPIGYPLGRWGEAKRKPVREIAFWDRWGGPPP